MGDDVYRGEVAESQPVPQFDDTPVASAPPLGKARVAIVTTAALRAPAARRFESEDETFRVLDAGGELLLDHVSLNFDRTGWLEDTNVVFPVDRFAELAVSGTIGSVAPRHISFLGAQHETLATIRLDSGPAAAKLLRDDGVDIVLLTGL